MQRNQLPLLLADHLEIRQIHQVQEVGGGDVVDLGLPALEFQHLPELQNRLPQMGIIGDDDPRRRRAQMMHQPQRAIDVLEHADGVGDHDVIERPLDRSQRRRILDVAQNKMQGRIKLPGLGDGPGAEIDADAIGRLQRREQISPAAAQFQDLLARRNQELHEPAIVFAIGGVELAPLILFAAAGFELLEQFPLSPAGKFRRSIFIWLGWIHRGPD